jgi:hypothetical protein
MKLYLSKIFSVMAIAALLVALSPVPQVLAAQSAGQSYLRFDRMKTATAPGSVLVVFTTSATTFTETQFRLTLDSEWVSATNFSTTAGNYTVSTAGLPVGVTAMPGINTATSVTGNTIVFPVTAMANSTTYGFFITGSGLISNPAASNTIVHTLATSDSVPTVNDTKDVASPTITDDQIVVTATVAPTFTFTIGSNTANLGTLSAASVNSGAGNSVTVLTNASYGWTAWMRSLNTGLASIGASKTVSTTGTIDAAPSSITAGTEGYVVDVNLTTDAAGGGTVSIAGEYNGTTTSEGGTLATTYQTIASSNGTANNDVITIVPRVTISGSTPAANDYTDTLTVVGAGTF